MGRHPRQTIIDTLVGFIGDRRLLLILDNLEQLRGANQGDDLLGRCAGLHILATSRAPLHVRGEREYAIGPLAVPADVEGIPVEQLSHTASIALFVDRAQAVDSAFALTAANAQAIAGYAGASRACRSRSNWPPLDYGSSLPTRSCAASTSDSRS